MASSNHPILEWYEHLRGRSVDLIGDYAGDELFLVEGDSMLRHVFETNEIDFHVGFQLLHAIHSVEVFLVRLLQRKCNFHVVFFDKNEDLCVPEMVGAKHHVKYIIARKIIIRHLQAYIPRIRPELKIMNFDSYSNSAVISYLQESSIYFIMCHDAASSSKPTRKHNGQPNQVVDVEHSGPVGHKVRSRSMLQFFTSKGYGVVLTNSISWKDTKVIAIVIEASKSSSDAPEYYNFTKVASAGNDLAQTKRKDGSLKYLDRPSESETLLLNTIETLLVQDVSNIDMAMKMVVAFVLIKDLSLNSRSFRSKKPERTTSQFLINFLDVANKHMSNFNVYEGELTCDLADFVDGRLFIEVAQTSLEHIVAVIDDTVQSRIQSLLAEISNETGIDLTLDRPNAALDDSSEKHDARQIPSEDAVALLPFSSPVFDKHLKTVRVTVDEKANRDLGSETSTKIFRELTHWHNMKPLQVKKKVDTNTAKQKFWALRSQARFMAEMTAYAASLTNAVGKRLEPITIITGSKPAEASIANQKNSNNPVKSGVKLTKKQIMLNEIAASKAKKEESAEDRLWRAWEFQLDDLKQLRKPADRYTRSKTYLENLSKDKQGVVGVEVECFMLASLLELYISECRKGKQNQALSVAALIWSLNEKLRNERMNKTVLSNVQETRRVLGLSKIKELPEGKDRALSFKFTPTEPNDESVKLSKSPKEFQLTTCGPYLDRTMDSQADSRVKFDPDGWQRRVLDLIDQDKSVFVVAPTSAGKTFISFYAMKKVLERDDDGVLIYVAPTKALVNQIAAEIQANYSKSFKYGGKSVWAIHTRDYRINDPNGCQILVTVPHVLQIMLLSPSNAKSWAPRVRRIIFDEIHCIGQADDGLVWEQLLLLAPSPIVALSATVGNPQEFSDWLTATQEAAGFDLHMVQHNQRYSDLRKYVYRAPSSYSYKGLSDNDVFGSLGLDEAQGFHFMHPVAALFNERRGLPSDLHLEPRDCLSLWKCLKKHETKNFPIDDSLNPGSALPDPIRKEDVIRWEAALKKVLQDWMAKSDSPFELVRNELSQPLQGKVEADLGTSGHIDSHEAQMDKIDSNKLTDTTLPLLAELHANGALPAILFNYDRSKCEQIGQTLLEKLTAAETIYKNSSPQWKLTLAKYEQWRKDRDKKPKKMVAKSKKKSSNDDGDEKASKGDLEREAADAEADPMASFDEKAPVDGFHFADRKKLLPSELAEYMWRLKRRNVADSLCDCITRGIGIHHAGMNRAYRQVVETLFRKGYLRVVIATGTLALGINMPCKTVVFSGDSVFLTALNFRQASGRAGRRGFDLLGNVVFQNIPTEKAFRLVSSKLPDLSGHFPITTSLVLRLFILLHESKHAPYAEKAINSLLSQPRLFLGGASFKEQVLHHLRFSIEYLRRQQLLNLNGAPLNFAGCVSHLYYTESSSFAFHALLKEGYFHSVCSDLNPKSQERILQEIMLVMAHLFGRRHCRQADQEFVEKVIKTSPSLVFLPRMPKLAESILHRHNDETLGIFAAYVRTFAEQHLSPTDHTLPLSGFEVGSSNSSTLPVPFLNSLPTPSVRSPFVALSGHTDEFNSISDLCDTARAGVFLEESVIPYIPIEMGSTPLNAYLLDFFKHGDIGALASANGIRRGDVWFLLNDFSLVLATIVTSLRNYMNLNTSDDPDPDLLNVKGGGDANEEAREDRFAQEDEAQEQVIAAVKNANLKADQQAKNAPTQSKSKGKVAESWDDFDIPDEVEKKENGADSWDSGEADVQADGSNIDEQESGHGLLNVFRAFETLKNEFDGKFRAMWA